MARMSLFSGNPSSVPVTLAPSDSLLHEQTGMSGAGASTVEYTNEAYLTARNEKIAFKTKKMIQPANIFSFPL